MSDFIDWTCIFVENRSIWPLFTCYDSNSKYFVNDQEMNMINSWLECTESKEIKGFFLNKFNLIYFVLINLLTLSITNFREVDKIMKILLSKAWHWRKRYFNGVSLMEYKILIKIWDFINNLWKVPCSWNSAIVCIDWSSKTTDIVQSIEWDLSIVVSFQDDILSFWNTVKCESKWHIKIWHRLPI